VLATLYFYFISKYWVWFQLFGWGLNLITIIGVIFMPESPKFLLTMKKYDECRRAMTIIGRFNGNKNDFDGKFDREIEDADSSNRVNNSEMIEQTTTAADPMKTPL
jgi:hypothetical protein